MAPLACNAARSHSVQLPLPLQSGALHAGACGQCGETGGIHARPEMPLPTQFPTTDRRRFLVGAAALAALPAAAEAEASLPPAAVLDVRGMPWEELCTAEALQGLANRRGPRVYLNHGEAADAKWLDIYAERAGLRTEPVASLPELKTRFRRDFRGVVLYDAAIDGSRYAAITAAGVLGALPVCADVLKRLPDCGAVRLDLRGRFAGSAEACAWALAELMPRCSRRLAHSVDGGRADGILTGVCGPMSGFDWQVMHRGFVFNLGSQAKKMVSYGGEVGGNPEHAALYERILAALKPPAQICGYGDPEDYWCLLLSRHGHYSFHAFHNWSFHSRVPVRSGALRQRVTFSPANVEPDTRRVSVCFMTSEGDTMKGPLPFFYGSWFDPARGKTAVNWGVNPLMARLFPAMLDYYYATATPNDGFFAGPSGAGYCYPDVMPDPASFGRHTGAAAREAGVECLDLWGGGVPAVQAAYSRAARPLGVTTFTSPARLRLLPDGAPIVHHELGYWQTDGLNGASWPTVFADPVRRAAAVQRLVARIERIASRVRPPFVVLVLGDLHSYSHHASLYAEVAAALDPDRFRTCRLDQAMAEVRAWASRRVVVGAESVNERPAWASLMGAETGLTLTLTNGRARATEATVTVAGTEAVRVSLKPHERREVTVATLPAGSAPASVTSVTMAAAGLEERLAIDGIGVPGGEAYRRATCVRVWGSDLMVHPCGAAEPSPGALRGTAWRSPKPDGKYQCLVCGPYSDLPAGRYVAAFRLQLAQPAPGAEPGAAAVTLDAAAGGYGAKGGLRASTQVRMSDLPTEGGWAWRLLEFTWQGSPDLLETRIWTHGSAELRADRIALFRVEA